MTLKYLTKSIKLLPFLLSNFRPAQPKQVDIELTNKCNLKCDMCWFHGPGGIGDKYHGSELHSNEVIQLINQLAEYRPGIYLGGCEPFMRPDLLQILAHIKSLNLRVTFTTNGTLLSSFDMERIAELGVDHIIFSVDGYERIHDQIRGRGVFTKVTSNIKELSTYRNKNKRKKPIISVNITVNPYIIGHLRESIQAIREATNDAVDFYRIHHLWYITKKELDIHQSQIKKYLNCSAPGAGCHIFPMAESINLLTLSEEILQLTNLPKVNFFPNLHGRDLHNYYTENVRANSRCFAPFYGTVIKPNGDVKLCPDEWIDDYKLGNIRQSSFAEIWDNAKARHFRSVIFWHKSFIGCKRCSWKYSF